MLNPEPSEATRAESNNMESMQVDSNHTTQKSPPIIEAKHRALSKTSVASNSPLKRPKVKSVWPKRLLIVGVLALVAVAAYSFIVPKHTEAHLTTAVKRGPFDVVVVETGELQSRRSLAITVSRSVIA